jgi:UDP-N-acetylglucosamine 2-epimerase (non-hydrolysing)/GDP/UDP-N,N'-diacetylbacillosamine 2-epimerase (hydrolysing)
LEASLDYRFQNTNLLVTFHPVTLEKHSAAKQFEELLTALDALGPDVGILMTKPNADTDGQIIIELMDQYVASRPFVRAYTSLGQLRYLSAMALVDAVVGNSSSGLYETPSFGKPTINIGDRQKGRLQADSVFNCEPVAADIESAVRRALTADCRAAVNPYGDGESSTRIRSELSAIAEPAALLKKHFFELNADHE